MVTRPLSLTPASVASEPLCIMGVVREREVEEEQISKRSRHALAIEPLVLQPENLGFERTDAGLFEVSITATEVNKCSQGRPCGSRNKPKEELFASFSLGSSISAFQRLHLLPCLLVGRGQVP